MEDDAVSTFVTITGAETEVAAHYLEACEYDLDRAVDQFMENENERHHVQTQQRPEDLDDRLLPEVQHPVMEPTLDDTEGGGGGGVFETQPHHHNTDEEFFDAYEEEPSGEAQNLNGAFPAGGSGVDLPDGVSMSDFNEARMLESAYYDVPFQGNLDELVPATLNQPPRPPSPSTLAARALREQQDAEFEESQRLDREKREAIEEERRKEREDATAQAYRESQEVAAIERLLESKASQLPMEPSDSESDSIVIMIRFPDGDRCSRRFRRFDGISSVFNFVDVHVNRASGVSDGSQATGSSLWWKLGGYNLVTRFPRRVIQEDSKMTLQDAGLNSKQEMLFVELK